MKITVRLYARLREIAGTDELSCDVPAGAAVDDLWRELVAKYPAMASNGSSIASAVNAEFARMTTALADGDEVAFLPPVSGG
jgi:molybdopterin converting factor subunit 1